MTPPPEACRWRDRGPAAAVPAPGGLLYHRCCTTRGRRRYTDPSSGMDRPGRLEPGAARRRRRAARPAPGRCAPASASRDVAEPVQLIRRPCRCPGRRRNCPAARQELTPNGKAAGRRQDADKRFELTRPPLLRAMLMRGRYGWDWLRRLVLTSHHILLDGWSMPCWRATCSPLLACRGDAAGLPPVTRTATTWPGCAVRTPLAARAWLDATVRRGEPDAGAPDARRPDTGRGDRR